MTILEREFDHVLELLFPDEKEKSNTTSQWIGIIGNFIFLGILIALLFKFSILARDYIFLHWIGRVFLNNHRRAALPAPCEV